jgi:O-antigen/teichoic acid export membrane protein
LAYANALVVSSVFGLYIFLKKVWPRIRGVRAVMNVREVLAFVIPITLNDLATRSFRTFNIAIFAVYRSAIDVSIFNVALKLTGVVFFFSGSLMSAFRPRISALLATGRNDLLSLEIRVFTRWILTFALLPFGLMIVFPADVLGLLGPQFLPAASTVRILCVGLLIAQAAGPLMTLLVMSGRSKQSVGFLALGAITYTTLSILTVPRYGTEGAAWSGLATIAFYAPIISVYVQRTLEIKLYGRRLVKPILAAIAAFSIGWLVSQALPSVAPDGPQFVRIGRSAAIIAVVAGGYVALLVKLGIEPEERAILANLRNPFAKLKRKLKKLVS